MIFLCTGIDSVELPLEGKGFHRIFSGNIIADAVTEYARQGHPIEAVVVSPHIADYKDLMEDVIIPLRRKNIRVIFLPGAPHGNDTRAWIEKMVPWGVYDYVYDPIRASDISYRIEHPSNMESIPNDEIEAANRMKTDIPGPETEPPKPSLFSRLFAKQAELMQQESQIEPAEDLLASFVHETPDDQMPSEQLAEESYAPVATRILEVNHRERRKVTPLQSEELLERLHKLEAQVNVEHLTGVYSRSFFESWAESQIQDQIPFCVGFLDFDGFKLFNDQHGHNAGDLLLSAFGQFLKKHTRETDVPTRWGGDEFIIGLPMTPLEDARLVFNRLRERWGNTQIPDLPSVCLFSIGVTEYQSGMTVADLVSQVDKLMYEDKQHRSGIATPIICDYTDTAIVGEVEYEPSRDKQNDTLFNGIKRSIVVATAANKGGVGKTTSSRSIAVTLANCGINTVLWDMDLGGANLSSFFRIADDRLTNYFDAFNIGPEQIERLIAKKITEEQLVGDAKIKEVIQRAVIPVSDYPNLYLLARPSITKLPNLPVNAMSYLLSRIASVLREQYRAVVVDTPQQPWTHRHLKGILTNTDMVYWITDQSKESLDESGKYSATLFSLGVKPANMRLVINRYDEKVKQIKPANIENVWKAKWDPKYRELGSIAGIIPVSVTAHINASYQAKILNPDEWKQVSNEIYVSLTGAQMDMKGSRKNIFGGLFGRKK